MVLSKALKAKLSLIPSGVANLSTPSLDGDGAKTPPPSLWALVRPLVVATAPTRMGSHWRALLDIMVCFVQGLEWSLSRWRKVGLPLALRIWAKF